MKTFDEEYKKLVDWMRKADAEVDEEVNNLPKIGGHDDRETPIRLKVSREWNRRLRELKEKYNQI